MSIPLLIKKVNGDPGVALDGPHHVPINGSKQGKMGSEATIHERHELLLVRPSYFQVLTPAILVDDEDKLNLSSMTYL